MTLEESEIIGVDEDNYTTYADYKDMILNLMEDEAKKIGISRRNIYYLKKKAKTNNIFYVKSKTLKMLLNNTNS